MTEPADAAPAAPPTATTREEDHLYLTLQRLSFCLDRYAARMAARRDPEGDEARAGEAILGEIAAVEEYLAARYGDPELPLNRLRRRFAIDDATLSLLLGAAAPAIDLSLSHRMQEMSGRTQPEAGFLVNALAWGLPEERRMLAALRNTSPVVRWRLVRFGVNKAWSPEAPVLHRPLVVPERVVDFLRGDVAFDPERFERVAELRPGSPEGASEELRDRVERSLSREEAGRKLPLVLAGPALVGKASAVYAAVASRGMRVLDVNLESVAVASQPVELLLDLAREAMLQDAVLLLRRLDAVDDKRAELRRALLAVMSDGALWVAATTRGDWRDEAARMPGSRLVELELPGSDEQLALWKRAFAPPAVLAEELQLEDVVLRYRLTPGDILEAGRQARQAAEQREAAALVTLDDVTRAVRARLRHRLGDVAELITTTLDWNDIVLPESVMSQVIELLASIRYQSRVMVEWGFERKVTYGRAVSALFSGPPGTGKTMVATLIARELGLELFRVDLSRVVSKWVGETEKNLGRAFDEAKNSQAVLLFDEADALFAKRTDVKSSNDRYANLEVNYLLQRLEAYEGIVLLTTNNQTSIDDAFRRRLRFRVEFASPDESEREQLWQAMLPDGAPVAADVDFAELARRYDMSGGYIKNAVVRAAYLAAADEEQSIITHELLVRAAQLEWEAMGRLTKG